MKESMMPIMRILAVKGRDAAEQPRAAQRMDAWLNGETTEPLEAREETGAGLEEQLFSKTFIQRSYEGREDHMGNGGGGRLH